MTDPDDDKATKSDWTAVTHIVQQQEYGGLLPSRPSLEELDQGAVPQPIGGVQPEGVVASFKASKISRKAALENLRAYYDAQLDAAKHQLSEAVRVRKAEATATAEQFLQIINSRQLAFLQQVGLRDEAVRSQAMLDLGNQTAAALKQITQQDWPEFLKQQMIQGIIDRQRKFFEKIMTDLGAS